MKNLIDVSKMDRKQVVELLAKQLEEVSNMFETEYGHGLATYRDRVDVVVLAMLADSIMKREDGNDIISEVLTRFGPLFKQIFNMDDDWLNGNKRITQSTELESKATKKIEAKYGKLFTSDPTHELLYGDYSEELKAFFNAMFENLQKLASLACEAIAKLPKAPDFEGFSFEEEDGFSQADEKFYDEVQEYKKIIHFPYRIYYIIDYLSNDVARRREVDELSKLRSQYIETKEGEKGSLYFAKIEEEKIAAIRIKFAKHYIKSKRILERMNKLLDEYMSKNGENQATTIEARSMQSLYEIAASDITGGEFTNLILDFIETDDKQTEESEIDRRLNELIQKIGGLTLRDRNFTALKTILFFAPNGIEYIEKLENFLPSIKDKQDELNLRSILKMARKLQEENENKDDYPTLS